MTNKPCSPYEEVKPVGGQTQAFRPVVTVGSSWQVEIVPGGDNYYQEVGSSDPCWDKPFRPQSSNHLEVFSLADLGWFDILAILEKGDNQLIGIDLTWLDSKLPSKSLGVFKDKIAKLLGWKSIQSCLVAKTDLDLITLWQIYMQSGLKNLDSVFLSLYTKKQDQVIFKDLFYIIGLKKFQEDLKFLETCGLKADQIIALKETLAWKSVAVIFQISLSFVERFLFQEGFAKNAWNQIEKQNCVISDRCVLAVGYGRGGYGLGSYGL